MKRKKILWIRGNSCRKDEIIQILKNLGGVVYDDVAEGMTCNYIYYIDNDKCVRKLDCVDNIAQMIMLIGTEIPLFDKTTVEGLTQSLRYRVFDVIEKIVDNKEMVGEDYFGDRFDKDLDMLADYIKTYKETTRVGNL